MRGATPLDVAAASVMDNNELALALREPNLEKVSLYLLPSSTELMLIVSIMSINTPGGGLIYDRSIIN